MPSDQVQDKTGIAIQEGDQVWTKIRGGKHEGQVGKIVTTKEEADAEGAKNPPKVRKYTTVTGEQGGVSSTLLLGPSAPVHAVSPWLMVLSTLRSFFKTNTATMSHIIQALYSTANKAN